jgi:hypothetical protein
MTTQFGMKPASTTWRPLAEAVEVYPNEDDIGPYGRDRSENRQAAPLSGVCKTVYERS